MRDEERTKLQDRRHQADRKNKSKLRKKPWAKLSSLAKVTPWMTQRKEGARNEIHGKVGIHIAFCGRDGFFDVGDVIADYRPGRDVHRSVRHRGVHRGIQLHEARKRENNEVSHGRKTRSAARAAVTDECIKISCLMVSLSRPAARVRPVRQGTRHKFPSEAAPPQSHPGWRHFPSPR